MTAPEPAPAVAWCEHYAPAGECCPQPTAPASGEPSPVEAAWARYPHRDPLLEGGSRQPLREAYVEGWKGCQTSLLSSDWLERVLGEHRIESTGRGEVTCRGCRERGWMSEPAFRAHQAAAIRAAAGVGL